MRAGAMFLLLLAAICAVSATSNGRPSYKEIIASSIGQQAAAAVRMNSAEHYHGVDHVCFSATQTCGNYYWLRSHLTCCKDEAPYYEKKSATEEILDPEKTGPMVGTCQMTIQGPCFALSANLFSHGTFQVHCELYGEAGACGAHDCGDLVLTAQGQALGLEWAIIHGKRPTDVFPYTENDCEYCWTGTHLKSTRYQTKGEDCSVVYTRRPMTRLNATAPGQRAQRRSSTSGAPKILAAENVYILSGPVTIASKSKETKWKEGWMEYTYAEEIHLEDQEWCEDMEGQNGGKLPYIDSDDFNNYKFQLYKNKGHY